MEITLKRKGGIIPLTKKASTEVNWTEKELAALIKKIEIKEQVPSNVADGTCYYLTVNNQEMPVELQKVPPSFSSVFQQLKADLRPEKIS